MRADFLIGGLGDDRLAADTPGNGAGDKAADSFVFEAAFGHDANEDLSLRSGADHRRGDGISGERCAV